MSKFYVNQPFYPHKQYMQNNQHHQLPTSTPTTTTSSPPTCPPSPKSNPLNALPSHPSRSSYALDPTTTTTTTSSSSSLNDDYEEDTLPYPLPLPRTDFLSPTFSAPLYLSTLGHNRHQTLEDLRSDLRARSTLLSRELLDLVNTHYEEFLSLGGTLRGGDDKVENVRVGVLAFQRAVKGVRDEVEAREGVVTGLLEERRAVRREVLLAGRLLGVEERLGELERRLMIEGVGATGQDEEGDGYDDDDEDEDDEEEEDEDGVERSAEARAADAVVRRLNRHAQAYLLLQHNIGLVGADHPFIVAQEPRTTRIRNTLLLDLRAALRQARKEGTGAGARTLELASIYRALGEGEELVNALKGA